MMNDRVGENVEQVIREAAETIVCPFFRNLEENAITTKTSPGDIVTVADIKSEAFLTNALSKILPSSIVLGEEGFYKSPEIKSFLNSDIPVWIVDPIDGTANYAKGSPIFGIIVSLVMQQQTIAGWMFDPLQDRMFMVERGSGVQRNGISIPLETTNAMRPLNSMTGCLGRRSTCEFEQTFKNFVHSGCSAHDYMALCEGDMDFRYFKSLNPWDHAAGVLMIEELGGIAKLMNGDKYTPIFHASQTMLVAQKSTEWQSIFQVLET